MLVRSAALLPFLAASLLTGSAFPVFAQGPASGADTAPLPPDKYLWLEDAHSARAMAWVKAEDARTAKVLEADPRFATFSAEALKVNEDPNRLPLPSCAATTSTTSGVTRTTFTACSVKHPPPTSPAPILTGKPSSISMPSAKKKTPAGSFTECPASIPALATHHLPFGWRRRCLYRSRIRSAVRPFRRRRLRLPTQQAERRVGRQGHPPHRPRMGIEYDDPVRLSIHRKGMETRHAARQRERDLPRSAHRHLCRSCRPPGRPGRSPHRYRPGRHLLPVALVRPNPCRSEGNRYAA